jgi:hypothetical protein
MKLVTALSEGLSNGLGGYLGSGGKNDLPRLVTRAPAFEDIVLRLCTGLDKMAGVATELATGLLLLPGPSDRGRGLDLLLGCTHRLHTCLECLNRLYERLAPFGGGACRCLPQRSCLCM